MIFAYGLKILRYVRRSVSSYNPLSSVDLIFFFKEVSLDAMIIVIVDFTALWFFDCFYFFST